VFAATSLPVLA